jgi:hypothetical protein
VGRHHALLMVGYVHLLAFCEETEGEEASTEDIGYHKRRRPKCITAGERLWI